MVWMTFRELLGKGARDKRIWLRVVQIARRKEVDYGEHFSGQIRKQHREQRCGNITSTNPTFRRAYNRKAIKRGRRQQRNISGRCACSENGQ